MNVIEEAPFAQVIMDGDEVATLLSTLERIRRTFAWKCGRLDADGLRATTAASTMTLGGLLKHLALVEADWFAVKLGGEPIGAPWDSADWDAYPDWEWSSAANDSPDYLYGLWNAAVTAREVWSPRRSPWAASTNRVITPGPMGGPRICGASLPT